MSLTDKIIQHYERKEINKMLTNIWQHPKSTAIGILQLVGAIVLNGRDPKTLGLAIVNAIVMGLLKDWNAPTTK